MVDWDVLVLGPLNGVYGEPVTYTPVAGAPFDISGVFDEAYAAVDLGAEPSVISARPVLGVRLSECPSGYDPENAQGDHFTVQRTGVTYVVKAGKTDGHGHARLEANLA
jgi:hypothetical protein